MTRIEAVLLGVKTMLEDPCLQLNTPKIAAMKELGQAILDKVRDKASATIVSKFSLEIDSILSQVIEKGDKYRSAANKRGKTWTAFHRECTKNTT